MHTSTRAEESARLKDLLAQFQDPSSPFHIPPGSAGPSGPDDHSSSRPLPDASASASASTSANTGSSIEGRSKSKPNPKPKTLWGPGIVWSDPEDTAGAEGNPPASPASSSSSLDPGYGIPADDTPAPYRATKAQMDTSRADAEQYFAIQGFDPLGVAEVRVAWGECDMFQHVNNVNYVRYVETARIHWCETLREELGEGPVLSMLQGKGMGFILKDIAVRYRHPVTYPDTLLIASRPHSIEPERASFKIAHALWSLKDNKLAATADSTLVMYDYDKKRKGYLDGPVGMALLGRSGGR